MSHWFVDLRSTSNDVLNTCLAFYLIRLYHTNKSRLQKCRSSLPREVLVIISSYAENLRHWLVPKPPFHSQLDDLMFPSTVLR